MTGKRAFVLVGVLLSATPFTSPVHAEGTGHAEGTAKLVIANPIFDFGTVREGTPVEADFRLRNDGPGELDIKRLQPACGCTAAVVDAQTLAAGAETTLHVKFDTSGFAGEKVKTVRLITNEPEQTRSVVTLKGTVKPDVTVDPVRVFFGDVIRGAAPSREVQIAFDPRENAAITSVSSRSEKITVESSPLADGRSGQRLTVTLSPDVPTGVFRGRVLVRTTSKQTPVVNINVLANILGPIQASPREVSFGLLEAPLAKPITEQVQLRTTGSESVLVTGVESDNDFVHAVLKPVEVGKSYDLSVTLAEGASGIVRARLKVRTNLSDAAQEFEVPVYAIIAKKGE